MMAITGEVSILKVNPQGHIVCYAAAVGTTMRTAVGRHTSHTPIRRPRPISPVYALSEPCQIKVLQHIGKRRGLSSRPPEASCQRQETMQILVVTFREGIQVALCQNRQGAFSMRQRSADAVKNMRKSGRLVAQATAALEPCKMRRGL